LFVSLPHGISKIAAARITKLDTNDEFWKAIDWVKKSTWSKSRVTKETLAARVSALLSVLLAYLVIIAFTRSVFNRET